MSTTLQRIAYSPLWLLLHAVALLPFGALYALSDALAWVAASVVRYRRRLVEANVAAAFPDKTEAERRDIVKRFYRNFTDVFVETIKLLHISDDEMRRRMVFEDIEHVERIAKDGRSIGLYCSHFGNWEWITSITLWVYRADNVEYSQVYRPLRNKWFDRFWFNLRKRFHSTSIPKTVCCALCCRLATTAEYLSPDSSPTRSQAITTGTTAYVSSTRTLRLSPARRCCCAN